MVKQKKNKQVIDMHKILLALTLIVSTIATIQTAFARIDIVPRKIVIENRERGGELTILNLAGEESTFRMELVSFKQNEEGLYEQLNTPLDPAFDPAKVVRFSPRQFTLQRGGRQKVRLSLRKPANLPEGEYRFHVKATRLAQPESKTLEDGVYMHANIGVTIPVIVRHGNAQVAAELSDIQIKSPSQTKRQRPEAHVIINRNGNKSAIGKLEVYWKADGHSEKKIGNMGHFNVFTDVEKRHAAIPLTEMPEGHGTLTVRYKKDIGKEKGELYDEETLQR